ncbi:hypothetical protein AB0392_11450 [Nonomuraea angiospora]|uniref:hypothetical protein n=1 Tax=Nonomuraea angiospora TaxID=46172 RepID=UPI00344FA64C
MDSPIDLPADAVLQVTASQRNNAMDELAKAHVVIAQLVAENERLTAELRAHDGDAADVQAAD